MSRHVVFLDAAAASDANLLDSLKRKGIKNLYLFTEEALLPATMKTLLDLKERLESQGFTVHRVASSSDLFWSFRYFPALMTRKDEYKNIVSVDPHPELTTFSRYIIKNDFTYVGIGSAFDKIAQSYEPEDENTRFDEDDLRKTQISTFLAKDLAR